MTFTDWNAAKNQVKTIIANNGVLIEWLQRTASGSNPYDYDDTTTYNYGDVTTYWTTGSFKAIIEPVRENDVVIEPGFYADAYKRLWLDPDQDCSFWDQVIIPSGSGIRYLILPVRTWNPGNVTVSKILMVRQLIPKSGSVY